jgi:glycosyltransferase involved in cell wall biosynthesis
MRPLALLFVMFHIMAPIVYLSYRLRQRIRFDLVQMVESNLSFGDMSYAHFCHRGYLRRPEARQRRTTLRGLLRWLDHALHALAEPWVFRRVRLVAAPSRGLAKELGAEYPAVRAKRRVIPNPVDVNHMVAASDFDRVAHRATLKIQPDQLAVVFAALGHFERKGLPLLLEALRVLDDPRLVLVVVGGQPDLVRAYRRRADALGVSAQVRFVGRQQDVRPFLWSADVFALPSAYEAFPLVVLEAAAARLPVLVTELHGVEQVVEDGRSGVVVERSVPGVAHGLTRVLSLPPRSLREMAESACAEVARYDTASFLAAWSRLYDEWSERRIRR